MCVANNQNRIRREFMSEESGLAEQRHFLSLAKSCRNISSEVRDAVVASRMVARFNCAI